MINILNSTKKLAKIIINLHENTDVRNFEFLHNWVTPKGYIFVFEVHSKKGFNYLSKQLNKILKIKGVNSIELLNIDINTNTLKLELHLDEGINRYYIDYTEARYVLNKYREEEERYVLF